MRWIAVFVLLAAVLVLASLWFALGGEAYGVRAAALPVLETAPLARDPAGGALAEPAADEAGRVRAESEGRSPLAITEASEPELATADERPLVRGRIVAPDGRPLAGAKVYLAARNGWSGPRLDSRFYSGAWGERHAVASGADGRFELAEAGAGEARLAVRCAGFAPLDDDELVLAGPVHDLGDLRLDFGALLGGRVVDAAGRPVEGAELVRVDTQAVPYFLPPGSKQGALLATTDAAGAFAIDTLAIGPWRVRVSSARHPDREFEGETDAAEPARAGLVFELGRGTTIAGRVLADDGVDTRELVVRALPAGRLELVLGGGAEPWREVACGERGEFRIEGLADEPLFRLRVKRASSIPWNTEWMSESVEAAPGARDVLLRVRAPREVTFRVVEQATGAPLSEFEVQWIARDGRHTSSEGISSGNERLTQEADGAWRLGGLRTAGPETACSLELKKPGYRPEARRDLAFSPSGVLDLGTLELQRLPTFPVRVLDDATGEPIAGAIVHLSSAESARSELQELQELGYSGEDENTLSAQATTDENGNAQLERVAAARVSLHATHKEHVASPPTSVALGSGEIPEVVLRLARGGALAVRVADARGEPVLGMKVRGARLVSGVEEPTGVLEGRTDARGTSHFEHLAQGTWRFHVVEPLSRGGAGSFFGAEDELAGDAAEVAIVEGGSAEIALRAAARGSLRGSLTEGARPLAGATLHLLAAGEDAGERHAFWELSARPQAQSDGAGSFEFAALRPGDYVLSIAHPSRAMPHRSEVRVAEGANRVQVELPVSIVEGRVLDEAGRPLEGALVRVGEPGEEDAVRGSFWISFGDEETYSVSSPREVEPARADPLGRYALRGVVAERELAVRAEHPFHVAARSEPLRLAPGEIRSGVDLVLAAAGALEVLVRDSQGQPLAHQQVVLRREGEEHGQRDASTDGTGRARIDGLAPGAWEARVLSDSEAPKPARRAVEIRAGETARVEIEVP